ncbi:MAG: hypothetical protein NC907_00500 [Candidatus Omnitrophica bacterium]|nr:hypothetical protein [Candidatus Omnitrophota bacterium]
MAYLNDVRIIKILPCLAMPERIRFIAEMDRDISEIMPYLNAVFEDAIYNHKGPYITLKKDDRLVSVAGKQLTGSKVIDLKDAEELIKWFKAIVNRCYENRNSIKPNTERRRKLTPLDIYKLLPRTNCKKCGEATCMAFAVKIAEEQKNILACAELFSGRFSDKKNELIRTLVSAGYKVPSEFREI